jgi:hypothetical protein
MTAWCVAHAAALLALGVGTARAQFGPVPVPSEAGRQHHEGRPHIRPERVTMEVVGGTYAGVAGYLVGRGIGTMVTRMMPSEQERTRDEIVRAIGYTGAAFAIGGTVYAIGDLGAESGSFPTTMAGVAAGAAGSLLLSKLIFHGKSPANQDTAKRRWLWATLEASLPAIGGTIAFNSSRKWQR